MEYPTISVIIPAWDEEKTIAGVVEAFMHLEYIRPIIIAVDSKTTDDTAITAGQQLRSLLNGWVLRDAGNGKGQVVTAALDEVRTEYVVFCDADITGLTADHISLLCADALIEEDSMTIGIADIPENYPENREWAWPWVSGIRCVPTRMVRPLHLHGYLMEVQLNAAAKHASMPARFEWLKGVTDPFDMTDRRLADMEKDARWGHEHGIL